MTAVPSTVCRPTVPDPGGGILGRGNKTERHVGEFAERMTPTRFTYCDDQQPGEIIGAVSVVTSGFGVLGMLEHPDAITHGQDVAERWQGHGDTDRLVVTSRSARAT